MDTVPNEDANIWITWDVHHVKGTGYRWMVRVVCPAGFNRKVVGDTLTRVGARWVIRRHIMRLRHEAITNRDRP